MVAVGRDVAEANARAAEANQKAEQERLARVQLEARLADRTLSVDQMERIRSRIAHLAGQNATVVFSDNFEASAFANEIDQHLHQRIGLLRNLPLFLQAAAFQWVKGS